MLNKKFDKIRGCGVSVPGDDIDTDRIIPASFMKCVTFDGLGQYAFYGERFDEDGNSKNHPLDAPEHKGASILISGRNFGCGSSREHAPQALFRFGIRAVIAENFAEIFFGNSTKLGMPCVSVAHSDRLEIAAFADEHPDQELEIDLDDKKIRAGDKGWPFTMNESALTSLKEGEWDPMARLLANADAIRNRAEALPYMSWNRG